MLGIQSPSRTVERRTGNTILVPKSYLFDPVLAGIPPGIGISWFEASARLGRVKSRYLLLDAPSRLQLGGQPGLEFVKETSRGDLYVNRWGDLTGIE